MKKVCGGKRTPTYDGLAATVRKLHCMSVQWSKFKVRSQANVCCNNQWKRLPSLGDATIDETLLYDNYVLTCYRRPSKLRQEVTGHS